MEVCLVKGIEKLGAELYLHSVLHLEILYQTEIPILQAGPIDDTPAGIAKSRSPGIASSPIKYR